MNITLDAFSLELDPPLSTASGSLTERRGIVVTVTGEATGVGEATPVPGWTESLDACRSALETARDRLPNEGRAAALSRLAATPAARHGLSLALLDHDAQSDSQPLYQYLGTGDCVEQLPVNATIGNVSIDETIAATETALHQNFPAIKLKVGNRPLTRELTRIARVIDLLPSDTGLRLDVNGSWSLSTTQRALSELPAQDISYIEQPLPPEAPLTNYASLEEYPVAIAVDEALTVHSCTDLISQSGIDVLILKPMVLGGIDRADELASIANTAGIDTVVTTTIDSVIARTAAVHLAARINSTYASGLATASRLETDLGPDPAIVSNGTIEVPQGTGLGVTLKAPS